jgi:hypothetical protein
MDNGTLHEELRDIREQLSDQNARISVLEATRALAWKWGVGVGSAGCAIMTLAHTIWSMLQ